MAENSRPGSDANEYAVRRFDAGRGDREGFLSLYETVWRTTRTPDWFAWRYEDNPYVDHVPVFVAESAAGDVVGARPLAAFRMRTAEGDVVALHPSDTMVHPDHRGQGLFTRMSAACTEFYTERESAFYFNFPNEAALGGNLKFGYRVVGSVPTYYRVQNPAALLDDGEALPDALSSGWRRRAAERAASALAGGYNGVRETLASRDRGVEVRRYASVPTRLLESLYERGVPDTIHAVRDAEFFGWRYADPAHPATTYVARRERTPVAAVVTYEDVVDGADRVKLADVLPMIDTEARAGAVRTLLSAIVSDHADADVVVAAGSAFPPDAMRAFGFRRDDRFPLSRATAETTLVAYPLVEDADADDAWRFGLDSLDEKHDWSVTFAERDTT